MWLAFCVPLQVNDVSHNLSQFGAEARTTFPSPKRDANTHSTQALDTPMKTSNNLLTILLLCTMGGTAIGCQEGTTSGSADDGQAVDTEGGDEETFVEDSMDGDNDDDTGHDGDVDQDGDGYTISDGDCDDSDPRWQPVEMDVSVEQRFSQRDGDELTLDAEYVSEYDENGDLVSKQDAYTIQVYVANTMWHAPIRDTQTFKHREDGQLSAHTGRLQLAEDFMGYPEGAVVGELDQHWSYDAAGLLASTELSEWHELGKELTEARTYQDGRLVSVEVDWYEPEVFQLHGYTRHVSTATYSYNVAGHLLRIDDDQVRYWNNSEDSAPTQVTTVYDWTDEGQMLSMNKEVDFYADGQLDGRFDELWEDTVAYNDAGLPVTERSRYQDYYEVILEEQTKAYDADGRLIRIEGVNRYRDSFTHTYTYDADGNLVQETVSYDHGGQDVTHYTYDDAGRTIEIAVSMDGQAAHDVTRFRYHEEGSLVEKVQQVDDWTYTTTYTMTYACP